jgi:hypothetical protein
MSNRLNQEREDILQPKRIEGCKAKLESLGFVVTQADVSLKFQYRGSTITFWPYSGWHSGKSIKDGRGFNNLLKQLATPPNKENQQCQTNT